MSSNSESRLHAVRRDRQDAARAGLDAQMLVREAPRPHDDGRHDGIACRHGLACGVVAFTGRAPFAAPRSPTWDRPKSNQIMKPSAFRTIFRAS